MGIHKVAISSKICFHALFVKSGWVACDGSLIFFLMSGDDGDHFGVAWWCVRDNLSDSGLFRCMSKVCLFFCLKNTSKKAVIY